MPHEIGDDLVIRVLLHKADFRSIDAVIKFRYVRSFVICRTAFVSVRHKIFLELSEQRALAASRFAAYDNKFGRLDVKGNIIECLFVPGRICKT